MSSEWVLVNIWWLGVVFAILISQIMIHHVDDILQLPDHPDGQHDT